MMETRAQLRLATTAIVAALAISSTPLLAQDAPPPDTSVETPVTPTADPLSPEPAADTSAAPETTAAPATQTTSEAAPARSTKAKAARRASTTSATRPSARPAPAPVGTVDTPAPALAAAGPVLAPPAAEAAIPPAPPVIVEPAASRQGQMTAILSIAAAVLLGLVALTVAVLAIRRRRRRAAEVEEGEWQAEEVAVTDAEPAMVEPEPVPVRTEPAFIAAAAPAVAMAPAAKASDEVEGPVTELPEGFDLSRFGHNVQEAYKGPTEDNPSLSLKHRLRRAGGMDQLERNMDAEVEAATGEPVLDESVLPPAEAPAARTAVADPAPGDFLLTKPGKEPVKGSADTH